MSVLDVNGFDIGYDAVGSGPPVLFTHGFQASRRMWAEQIAALEPNHRAIAWDLRGHGESGAPDDETKYSHELLVGDMLAMLDHFEVDKAVLVGHSFGGFASMRFYLDHPDRVAGFVAFATGPGYRDPEAREKWNAGIERAARGMEKYGLEILKRGTPDVSEAEHTSAQAIAHAGRNMLTQLDSRVIDAVPEIAVPTLVIVGSEDKMFMGSSQYLAAKIPGARLVVLEGAAHAAGIEQPEAFNAELLGFLGTLPR